MVGTEFVVSLCAYRHWTYSAMVEQTPHKRLVGGSSPSMSTKKGNTMNILQCKHLDFVPSNAVKGAIDNSIYVFSHQYNGKMYKRKKFFCGRIFINKNIKSWSFCPAENWCFGCEFLSMVTIFIRKLDNKMVKYDAKKGEIIAL